MALYASQLFAGESLAGRISRSLLTARRSVEALDDEAILTLDVERWVAEEVERHAYEPLGLKADEVEIEEGGSGRPLVMVIPFDGDAELLSLDPRKVTGPLAGAVPPHAHVGDGVIKMILTASPGVLDPSVVLQSRLDTLEVWIQAVRAHVLKHRSDLERTLRDELARRRQGIENHRAFLAAAPVPVRKRGDAPRVFRGDPVTRRETPPARARATAQDQPRIVPVLSDEYFDHIVSLIRAAGRAMTRSPETYAGWKEESRRQALLLILNTHYEGQAHGEAFNGSGKTDILIRVDDVNIFIGECGFWSGRLALTRKVDQLLRYATWHDARLALIVFVREGAFTAITETARRAIEDHGQFAAWDAPQPEGEFRCQLHMSGDLSRRLTLHTLLIHTPAEK